MALTSNSSRLDLSSKPFFPVSVLLQRPVQPLARLEDVDLIRCDCMIMKQRNAMSEQLTQHKGLRPLKILISSECHQGSPRVSITAHSQISFPHLLQAQGCLCSLVCPTESFRHWSWIFLLPFPSLALTPKIKTNTLEN